MNLCRVSSANLTFEQIHTVACFIFTPICSSWYPAHRRPWTEIHILAIWGLGGVGGGY